jgi:hypothetical protein
MNMNTQELSDDILDDMEQDRIKKFIGDDLMFQAVKKHLLSAVYSHGVMKKGKPHVGNRNYALGMAFGAINTQGGMPRSDEELGQNARALAQGVALVESGFQELAEMKEVEIAETEDKGSNVSE